MKIINVARTITEQKYVANDGQQFDTEAECLQYEQSIDERIEKAKQIESIDCEVPFSSWYIDAEESKIYTIRSQEEYDNLHSLYASECSYGSDDYLYWDEPIKYPVAMLIMSRECCSCAYVLEAENVQAMYNAALKMSNAYFDAIKEEI